MSATGVYMIRNRRNEHRYIGSAIDLEARFQKHRSDLRLGRHHAPYLQNAWRKYGESAFVFEVVIYCDPSLCLNYEQAIMDALRPEYNSRRKASSNLGIKYSPESCARISRALTGRPKSEEHRRKLAKPKSPLHRARLSLAHKGKGLSEDHRRKLSLARKGKPLSAEHRARIGAALKGRIISLESRAKMSAAKKGKPRAPRRQASE